MQAAGQRYQRFAKPGLNRLHELIDQTSKATALS